MMSIRNRLERLSRDRRLQPTSDDFMIPADEPLQLKTAADILTLLAEQVQAVRADYESSASEKARTIGFLAGAALKALDVGNLQARVEMLEMVLKLRNGDSKG